ncbi:MAG: hypothetical protein ACK5LT_06400 [Lachnospirales bacterium]
MKQIRYKLILIIISLVFLLGCVSKNNDSYQNIPYTGTTDILFTSISFDSIAIDGSNTSLVGKWSCIEDKLVWGDFFYGSFYIYDTNFNFEKKVLSQGKGPNEIPSKKWVDYTVLKDKIFILGSSYGYHLINSKTWKKLNSSRLNFSTEETNIKDLINNPKPDNLAIYEVNYPGLNLGFLNAEEIVFSISTSHPKINAYTSRLFYDESKSIAVLNLKENKITDMLANYSPIYKEYEYIPQFSNVLFTEHKGKLLFSFEADSLIYNTNKKHSISNKFGIKGKKVSSKYPEINSTENYVNDYKIGRIKHGYYKYLKQISETGILFRGYQKDSLAKEDGLQVYRNNVLIGDVSVPKNFQVIGYIKPYYYAQIQPDDLNEEFVLFKFKLEY